MSKSAASRRLAVVAAAFLLYLVSYLLLVDPQDGGRKWGWRTTHYRVGGRVAEVFYAPVENVDRAFRPGFWAVYNPHIVYPSNIQGPSDPNDF
jgi:hypothetical protein